MNAITLRDNKPRNSYSAYNTKRSQDIYFTLMEKKKKKEDKPLIKAIENGRLN